MNALRMPSDAVPIYREFDVREMVHAILTDCRSELSRRNIDVQIDVATMAFFGDRRLLGEALSNLISNAIEVMPQGGDLLITSVLTSRGLEVEVADSGPGVEKEDRGWIFKPHVTTTAGGRGLGLTSARQIARQHGGEIEVMNCPEGGAAFTILVPRRVLKAAA